MCSTCDFFFEESNFLFLKLCLLLHALSVIILTIVFTVGVLLVPPFITDRLVCFFATVLTMVLIFVMVEIVRYAVDKYLKKIAASIKEKCRIELMMAFGGVALTIFVSRIAVFWFSDHFRNYCYITIVTIITILLLTYRFFLEPMHHIKSMNYEQHDLLIILFSIAYFFAFVVSWIVVKITEGGKTETPITVHYIMSGITDAICVVNFILVRAGAFEIHDMIPGARVDPEAPESPKMPDTPPEDTLTDSVVLVYGFIAILMILYGFWHTIFTFDWAPPYICLLSATVIVGGVALGKQLMRQKELKIGFLGIAISGFFPRLGVYFIAHNFWILYFFIFSSIVSALSFHYFFVLEHRKTYKLNHDSHYEPILKIILVQTIVLLVMIRIGWCSDNNYEADVIMWTQIGFFFLSLTSFIDYYVVLNGKLQIWVRQEAKTKSEVRLKEPEPLPAKKRTPINILCPKCRLPYSDDRTPRILKECGDTICEGCADQLLDAHGKKYLQCPICMVPTVVQGPANFLKKNFGVMDVISYVD